MNSSDAVRQLRGQRGAENTAELHVKEKPSLTSLHKDLERLHVNKTDVRELGGAVPAGSVLYPGSKAYKEAIFIGNLDHNEVPAVVIQAVSVEDVIATVKFAKKNSCKLTVKSGGHSYAGYCLNDGGIVLDISSMNSVEINDKDMTMTIQGGAVWRDAYSALKGEDIGLMVIGGQCPTVGVSAFLLGGGLSPFSRSFGLGVDNLLEMTIVTADGNIVTVNKDNGKDDRKRDLFWAVRGGGGGNFGITIGVKVRIHQLRVPGNIGGKSVGGGNFNVEKVSTKGIVVCGQLSWNLPEQVDDFNEMMNVLNTTRWPEEVTADAIWRYDDHNQLKGQLTIIYNGTMDQCVTDIAKLFAFNPENSLKAMHWTDWEAIDARNDVLEKVYHHHGCIMFGEEGITREVTNIIISQMEKAKTLVEDKNVANSRNTCHILWNHIGNPRKVKDTDTAFFWRKAVYVVKVRAQWVNPDMEKDMLGFVNDCKQRLFSHSLQYNGTQAAYVNYIDSEVKTWHNAYYGANYQRLLRIKNDWDSERVFLFPRSIGASEDTE